jgi:hypothetical protein
MARKNRNLSNRVTGASETIVITNKPQNISAGIAPQFTAVVENKDAANPVRVALIPADFDTKRIVDGKLVYDNVSELVKAGYPVGAVLCEGTFADAAKSVSVVMAGADPARTIRHFLDHLKLNPSKLRNLEIVSSDANAFDTNMLLTEVNPFTREVEQSIDLSTMYDLYQEAKDRIRIDLEGNEIELSDITLLTATIPPATKMKFIFRF